MSKVQFDLKKIVKCLAVLNNAERLKILQYLQAPEEHINTSKYKVHEFGVCVNMLHHLMGGISQPTLSLYLKQLEEVDFVSKKRVEKFNYYKVNTDHIKLFLKNLQATILKVEDKK